MKNIFDSVKANKRKVFIGISLVFSMFLIAFASYNVNKLFANLSGDETPINTAFDDINFYKCVVDRYNTEEKASKNYKEDSLSNSELSRISNLDCSNQAIKSVKGIEKLTNLEILDLSYNELTSIDFSKNEFLKIVTLKDNELTNVVKNTVNLRKFNVYNNKLNEINVSDNVNLELLDASSNKLTSIDVSSNTNLETLNLSSNDISDIDLSNNVTLKVLDMTSNKISSIDLSKNISLTHISLDNNKLKTIDLSNNEKLNNIQLVSNNLSSINIGNKPELKLIQLYDNNLSYIDFSGINGGNAGAITVGKNNISQNIPTLTVDDTFKIVDKITPASGCDIIYDLIRQDEGGDATISDKTLTAVKEGDLTLKIFMSCPRENKDNMNFPISTDQISIVQAELSSKKYVIDNTKKYVYTKKDSNLNVIKNNLFANIGDIVIEDKKVKVVRDEKTLLEYNLINYDSDYEIKDDYILVKDNVFDENKIRSNSDDLTFNYNKKNNIVDTVDIIYKGEVIDTLKNSSYKIKDYEIVTDGENKKYIYLKNKSFDESKIEVINCSYEIKDNKIIIKAGDNILDEIYLSRISIKDSKYGIEDSSIYTDTNDLNKDDIICINGSVEGAGDYTYKIIVAGKVVDTISVIKLDISDESKKDTINKYGYMYVGIRKATELSDFKVINGYIEETNDKLTIYTSNDKKHIIKTIKLLKISSDKYDLVGGYSKKDNGYYIYMKSIDLNSIKMSEELIIKSKNDGDYVIALKTDNTEFESLYASYIMEDSSYKLKDDKVYYGLRSNKNLTLKVKNGYAQKNNGEFDIYLNNGKKTDYMKIIALITDYVSDNNYDFKNGVLDLGDDVFNPLHITDKINADIEYSTKDNVLKILHDGKVVGQIKIRSKANIKKTITTTTSKVTNTTSSTTKVSTTTTTTTKLETRSNRITTKNVGNKNSSCSRCKMLKVFTLSLIILYILYLIYIIYTFKKEKDRREV